MKANELMIGDWVEMDSGPVQIEDISIAGYCSYRFGKANIGANVKNLMPIPLTAEILEKNGFELRLKKVWRWTSEDERTEIRFVLGAEHIHIIKNAYYEDEVEFSLPCPNCVHELQHALRLCGIEKEITL